MSANLRKLIDETAAKAGPEIAACFTDAGATKVATKHLEAFAEKLIAEFGTKQE